jgi:hypothetical protein
MTIEAIASNAQIAKDRRKWNSQAMIFNFGILWQFSAILAILPIRGKVLSFCLRIYNRLSLLGASYAPFPEPPRRTYRAI